MGWWRGWRRGLMLGWRVWSGDEGGVAFLYECLHSAGFGL